MTITAWRIYKKRHARTAFTGLGARLFGGRWTSPGLSVVYTAQTQSLAVLEMAVHLEAADALRYYEMRPIGFDARLMNTLTADRLPKSWRQSPPPLSLRIIGDEWVTEKRSLVLAVPSAVVPAETNYLINAAHPDFNKIALGPPEPFRIDPRLLG